MIENAKDAEPNDHRDNVPLAEAAERSHRLLRDKWQWSYRTKREQHIEREKTSERALLMVTHLGNGEL